MGKTSKVVTFGQKSTGKSSVLEQLIYGHTLTDYEITPTIEDVYVANIDTDRGVKEKIRVYDTSGLEPKSREVARHYLHYAEGYILVYAINNLDSFTTMDYIKKDLDRNRDKKEVTIIALGNKKDLDKERAVDPAIAQSWASREKVKLFEVSAKDRSSLLEPFVYLATKLNPSPSKSSFAPLGRRTKPTNNMNEI